MDRYRMLRKQTYRKDGYVLVFLGKQIGIKSLEIVSVNWLCSIASVIYS